MEEVPPFDRLDRISRVKRRCTGFSREEVSTDIEEEDEVDGGGFELIHA